jgi:hypothetical protein
MTRERIFSCAMDLFMSYGHDKTTMRMIVDRANVNVALSYVARCALLLAADALNHLSRPVQSSRAEGKCCMSGSGGAPCTYE